MDFWFPVAQCPRLIRNLADQFNDLFTSRGEYVAFVALLCAAIFGISGLCNTVRFLLFSPSVSALSRFMNLKSLFADLNRRHRRSVLRIFGKALKDPKRFIWAIDDTLIPHSGKNIWGVYKWHDHCTGGVVNAHKLLVLGLVDRKHKVLIPVFWEILHREIEGSEVLHKKGWEVAINLIDAAVDLGFPKLPVVADSWFAGEGFFKALNGRKIRFVVEIKSNRIVTSHGADRDLYVRVDEYFRNKSRTPIFYRGLKKWSAESLLGFKDSSLVLKTVAVANKKGLAHDSFAFYVSNQPTWNASAIWAAARDRWTIEVQFRDFKQSFTLGEAAVRSKQAVETSISVSVIALSGIRIEQIARADANKNQNSRPIPAGAIVNELRTDSLRRGISMLVHKASWESILKRIHSRIRPENFGKKPTEEYL